MRRVIPRKIKPNYPVGINRGNSIARKIGNYWGSQSGGLVQDIAGKHHATRSGAIWSPISGNTFNGTSDYLESFHAPSKITGWPLTIFARIRASSTLSIDGSCIGIGNSSTSTSYLLIWQMADGTIMLTVRSGGSPFNTISPSSYSFGQWLNIAGVIHSDTDRKLYVNGVEVASSSTSIIYPSGLDNVNIGRLRRSAVGQWLKGDVESSGLIPYALTPTEIKSLHENPYQVFEDRTQYIPVGAAFKPYWANNATVVQPMQGMS